MAASAIWVLRSKESYKRTWEDLARAWNSYSWTAPSEARRGDVAVLYCPDWGEAGIVGVFLTDAVKGKDKRIYWAEIDLTRVVTPVTRDELKESTGELLRAAAASLGNQGYHQQLDQEVGEALLRKMLAGSTLASRRVRSWRREPNPPFGIDLANASGFTTLDPDYGVNELELQDKLFKHLKRRGPGRRKTRLRPLTRDEREALDLESSNYLGREDFGDGARQHIYPDIVMVRPGRPPTLVVIEVKRHAVWSPGRNGVDQLSVYERRLSERMRSSGLAYRLEPILLAVDADSKTVREAHKHGFGTWRAKLSKRGDSVRVRVIGKWA